MEQRPWRDEILQGVEYVPRRGKIDTLIVYGQNAEAILTGRGAHGVFIAAGQYGQGRVVVFSGRDYAKEMEKESQDSQMVRLRSNILKWLRPQHNDHQVINITDERNVDLGKNQNQVLLWEVEHKRKSPKFVQDVSDFVRNGGAVIITKNPSGYEWRQGPLDKSPVFEILHEAGIYFAPRAAGVTEDKYVANNEAHMSHLGKAIEECLEDSKRLMVYGAVLAASFKHLPNREELKNKLRRLLSDVESFGVRYVPRGKKKKVKTTEGLNLAHFVFHYLWDPESGKAPGCEEFPGDFDIAPEPVCIEVAVESKYTEAHPLGVYLPPGEIVKVEVTEGDVRGWRLRVGAHLDKLYKKDNIKRWFEVGRRVNLASPLTEVFSPFGGLIYLMSPNKPRKIRVRISNVIESPYYDMRKADCDETWKDVRQRPGLWADLKGKHMHITVPSTAIRDFNDVRTILEFWDTVIENLYDLRGTKAQGQRGQWVLPDEQPSAGSMHSGYPIVTHLGVVEENPKNYVLGTTHGSHWGIFHEMGHNLQRGPWTPQGYVEVTCNIFSMYGMYIMYGIEPWEIGWVENAKTAMKKLIEKGVGSAGGNLGKYAQLARDFGWEAFKKVFRSYMKDKDKPQTDQAKFDTWVLKFSKAVGYNIAPAYELWRVQVSDNIKEELKDLTPYMPDDEVTQVVPDRVRAIAEKYPGIVNHPEKVKQSEANEESCQAEEDEEGNETGGGSESAEEGCSD